MALQPSRQPSSYPHCENLNLTRSEPVLEMTHQTSFKKMFLSPGIYQQRDLNSIDLCLVGQEEVRETDLEIGLTH